MKRTVWVGVGFGLGLYVGEKVRRAVVKATPDAVTDRVRSAWSDALAAGRNEMRARERALRETVAAPDPDRADPPAAPGVEHARRAPAGEAEVAEGRERPLHVDEQVHGRLVEDAEPAVAAHGHHAEVRHVLPRVEVAVRLARRGAEGLLGR